MNKSKVLINQKGGERIKAGHPWVFRSDLIESSDAEPGEIVSIFSQKGQFLGKAFFNPRSQITLRLLTKTHESINREFWKARILQSIERRQSVGNHSDGLRLIFGEADFLPSLILDRYRDLLVFQTLSLGMDRIKEDLISLFEEILKPSAIVERNDPPVRDLEGLVRSRGIVRGGLPAGLEIREGERFISVDPIEGQKTGLFLDQTENHLAAARHAKGRVLDLFCYQGGFAIQMARLAEEVVAVDSSAPALNFLQRNCERNGLNNVRPVEANGFDFLRECQDKRERFDRIVLDPPPFVRDRKSMMGALRGYKEINLRAMKILAPGGILISCSCSQHFTPRLFEETLSEASRDAKREIQVLEVRGAGVDHPTLLTFPESSYLQCWIVRVL